MFRKLRVCVAELVDAIREHPLPGHPEIPLDQLLILQLLSSEPRGGPNLLGKLRRAGGDAVDESTAKRFDHIFGAGRRPNEVVDYQRDKSVERRPRCRSAADASREFDKAAGRDSSRTASANVSEIALSCLVTPHRAIGAEAVI
jgi:hypothetical protein